MKGKHPMMIIAIGVGKKRDDDEKEDMMEDEEEMAVGGPTKYGKGGMSYSKGGMTRGGRDGCAIRGKTKGRMV